MLDQHFPDSKTTKLMDENRSKGLLQEIEEELKYLKASTKQGEIKSPYPRFRSGEPSPLLLELEKQVQALFNEIYNPDIQEVDAPKLN